MIFNKKTLLIISLSCFAISAVIRIDARILSFLIPIQNNIEFYISYIAAIFGATGGALLLTYYLVGFLSARKKAKHEN